MAVVALHGVFVGVAEDGDFGGVGLEIVAFRHAVEMEDFVHHRLERADSLGADPFPAFPEVRVIVGYLFDGGGAGHTVETVHHDGGVELELHALGNGFVEFFHSRHIEGGDVFEKVVNHCLQRVYDIDFSAAADGVFIGCRPGDVEADGELPAHAGVGGAEEGVLTAVFGGQVALFEDADVVFADELDAGEVFFHKVFGRQHVVIAGDIVEGDGAIGGRHFAQIGDDCFVLFGLVHDAVVGGGFEGHGADPLIEQVAQDDEFVAFIRMLD